MRRDEIAADKPTYIYICMCSARSLAGALRCVAVRCGAYRAVNGVVRRWENAAARISVEASLAARRVSHTRFEAPPDSGLPRTYVRYNRSCIYDANG